MIPIISWRLAFKVVCQPTETCLVRIQQCLECNRSSFNSSIRPVSSHTRVETETIDTKLECPRSLFCVSCLISSSLYLQPLVAMAAQQMMGVAAPNTGFLQQFQHPGQLQNLQYLQQQQGQQMLQQQFQQYQSGDGAQPGGGENNNAGGQQPSYENFNGEGPTQQENGGP